MPLIGMYMSVFVHETPHFTLLNHVHLMPWTILHLHLLSRYTPIKKIHL